MANLLKETIEILAESNKSENDVMFCAVGNKYFTFDKFKEISNFQYDNGYGGHIINNGLLIVGDDWWLERGEYDGSEWWEFKTICKLGTLDDENVTIEDIKQRW